VAGIDREILCSSRALSDLSFGRPWRLLAGASRKPLTPLRDLFPARHERAERLVGQLVETPRGEVPALQLRIEVGAKPISSSGVERCRAAVAMKSRSYARLASAHTLELALLPPQGSWPTAMSGLGGCAAPRCQVMAEQTASAIGNGLEAVMTRSRQPGDIGSRDTFPGRAWSTRPRTRGRLRRSQARPIVAAGLL
jgi:hypothetical protein